MTPPFHVLQGTWEEIKTRDAELTGREVRVTVFDKPEPAPNALLKSFEEVFGPLQKGFEQSGMTEEELNDFVDAEMKAYREERRAKAAAQNE